MFYCKMVTLRTQLADDMPALVTELRRHGHRRVGIEWLISQGVAALVATEKFDRVRSPGNCVDYQFDHPGRLASGVSRQYRIAVGDYNHDVWVDWSH